MNECLLQKEMKGEASRPGGQGKLGEALNDKRGGRERLIPDVAAFDSNLRRVSGSR